MVVVKMAVVVVQHMAVSSVTVGNVAVDGMARDKVAMRCVAMKGFIHDVVTVSVSVGSNAIVIVDMNIWLSYAIHYNIVGDTVEEIEKL